MNKQVLAALVVAFILGGVHVDYQLGKVEQHMADIEVRVQRIERRMFEVADADP